jgi:hypothetical protein
MTIGDTGSRPSWPRRREPAVRTSPPAASRGPEAAAGRPAASPGAGKTNWQLAKDLGLAEGTVRKRLEKPYRRLGVNNRTEALARVAMVATQ